MKSFLRNIVSFESLPPVRSEGSETGSGASDEAEVQGEYNLRNYTGTHLTVHKGVLFLENLAQGYCQTELNIRDEKNVSLWLTMAKSIHASPLHPETPLKKEQ